MTTSLNRVELTGDPGREALKVGGHSLPFTAASLTVDRNALPLLTVDLPVLGGMVVTLGAHAEVSGRTREALVAMGWTPPPPEPPSLDEMMTGIRSMILGWAADQAAKAVTPQARKL